MYQYDLSQGKQSLHNEKKIFLGKTGITILVLILCGLGVTLVTAEGNDMPDPGVSGSANVMSSSSGDLRNIMNALPVEDKNGDLINPSSDNLGNIMNSLPVEDENGDLINPSSDNLGNIMNAIPVEDENRNSTPKIMIDMNTTDLIINLTDITEISLKENQRAGNSWNLTNSTGLVIVSDEYIMDNATKGMNDIGGVHTWTVKAVENGSQTISAIMLPVAGNLTGTQETYMLNVTVRGINGKPHEEISSENPLANISVI